MHSVSVRKKLESGIALTMLEIAFYMSLHLMGSIHFVFLVVNH